MLAEMKNAFENGNASALGNALKNLTDVDRQNHEASKEYVGAVQTFSQKVDSFGRGNKPVKDESQRAAAEAQVKKEGQVLAEGRRDQQLTTEQIKGTTDPVAKSRLTNQLETQKSVNENTEASVAAKKTVVSQAASTK